jgi:hypothetical protein
MKTSMQKSATAEKKPRSTATPVLSSAAPADHALGSSIEVTGIIGGKNPGSNIGSFGSPSAAIWSRYIDSRMKQFGTR